MERTTIDLWVGVFVALGLAAIFGLALKVGNLTSSSVGDTYTVTAAFENIGGRMNLAKYSSYKRECLDKTMMRHYCL